MTVLAPEFLSDNAPFKIVISSQDPSFAVPVPSTALSVSPSRLRAALDDSLTVVEAIIDFFVDTYRSTFLCFLQLVVQAGLAVLGAATAEATTFVESAANTIANSIDQSFSAAMSGIQSAISAANIIPGINIPAPSLTPPDLSSLQNLQLPSTFQDQLNNLSSPKLVELRQIVDNIIDAPFSALRDEIHGTFASLVTDPSIFPIPGPVNLTFCDQFDTSTIDGLAHEIKVLAMWCTVVMILATVGMIGINCGWQIYRNHQLTERLKRIQRNLQIDAVPMDAQLLSMHSEIERLRTSHWGHYVAYLACAPNGSTPAKIAAEWLGKATAVIFWLVEPFGCARQISHVMAQMACAQPL
ncbi:hypothetical protein B0H11DRAFT_2420578 [Mycena galericulata]|nr:hypothetical protein B0H11DRAFT_2420578 [Mycena galericulata]